MCIVIGVIKMKIELYVVTSELYGKDKVETLSNLKQLEELKRGLCEKYGGLTVIKNCEGLWLNEGKLYVDKVEIWRIFTDDLDVALIKAFAISLKVICKQQSQLYTIDDKAFFV
jgi:hypothetical protein